MHPLVQAAILGIIQGLTEFLPISSSAHLIIVRQVFGWRLLDDPHWNMIFDVSAHAGTFVALLVYFQSDIRRLIGALLGSVRAGMSGSPERRLVWIVLLGAVPGGAAGWLGQDTIEGVFRRAPTALAALLVVFGLILWEADRRGRKARDLSQIGWLDGALIGCAQALALAPGVSRSGITMTAGLARGFTREAAARFSFLLSLPIIAGALLFGIEDVIGAAGGLPYASLPAFATGFLTAAVSGYFCIGYFLSYLQRHALAPFVAYRVAVGILLLLWFAVGSVQIPESPVPPSRRPLRGEGIGGQRVATAAFWPGEAMPATQSEDKDRPEVSGLRRKRSHALVAVSLSGRSSLLVRTA